MTNPTEIPVSFKPPVTLSQVNFQGNALFSETQRITLQTSIRDTLDMQPHAVRAVMDKSGLPGWDLSGFPNTRDASRVEQIVKLRGCAMIAHETAQMLGGQIPNKELLRIIEENRFEYDKIPQAVYDFLSQ